MKKINKFHFLLLLVVFSMGFVPSDKDLYLEIAKSIEIFGKVYKEISINYVDQINPEDFMHAGIKGMLSELDPYTVFLDEAMQKDFDLITNGKYGGIGASVGIRNEKITIIDVLDDSPARRHGLRIGDIVLKINEKEINKNNFDKMSEEIAGDPGREVKLVIKREGIDIPQEFLLKLGLIEIKNISFTGFFPESSNTAYIKLSNFSRGSGQEIKQAILELGKIKKIKSLILDLRNNPGGLLDQAIDVCEKFLDKGNLIVSVSGRDSTKKINYYSQEEPLLQNVPIAVLVNENTASAAEIIAGAIQDHDRGIIIGQNTFGKGLVQTIVPISKNTSLKITTAKYFTPSGRCIQKIDYYKHDNNFETPQNNNRSKYFTDNSRKVYSNGGITPDTIFENKKDSELMNDLKSKNIIDDFTNFYTNTNDSINYKNLNEKKLFDDFLSYLKNKNYKFCSLLNNDAKKLLHKSETNSFDNCIIEQLKSITFKFDQYDQAQISKQRDEIVSDIKIKLYNRIAQKSYRYKFLLNDDSLIKVAVNLLENKNKVDALLKEN